MNKIFRSELPCRGTDCEGCLDIDIGVLLLMCPTLYKCSCNYCGLIQYKDSAKIDGILSELGDRVVWMT
jgi:hypothetical protein